MAERGDERRTRVGTSFFVTVIPLVAGIVWSLITSYGLWVELTMLLALVVVSLAWGAIYYVVDASGLWPVLILGQWLSCALIIWVLAAVTGDDVLGGADRGWLAGLWWGLWAVAFWMIPVAVLRTTLSTVEAPRPDQPGHSGPVSKRR